VRREREGEGRREDNRREQHRGREEMSDEANITAPQVTRGIVQKKEKDSDDDDDDDGARAVNGDMMMNTLRRSRHGACAVWMLKGKTAAVNVRETAKRTLKRRKEGDMMNRSDTERDNLVICRWTRVQDG
jgi:hypothetical protein